MKPHVLQVADSVHGLAVTVVLYFTMVLVQGGVMSHPCVLHTVTS